MTLPGSGDRAPPSPEDPNPEAKIVAIIRQRGEKARNVSQKIWLSSAEAEQVKASAGETPVAAWLRALALGQPSPPPRKGGRRPSKDARLIQPLTVAVARVGNNLNQIARAVNLAGRSQRPLDAVLVANQLAQIRHEMRVAIEHAIQKAPDAGKDL